MEIKAIIGDLLKAITKYEITPINSGRNEVKNISNTLSRVAAVIDIVLCIYAV